MILVHASRRSGGSTVTVNTCSANRPPGSVALTVTSALPSASPSYVTVLPLTLTSTKSSLDDLVEYFSASSSGSSNFDATPKEPLFPTSTVRSVIVPTAVGFRFGWFTVTLKL